MKTFYFLYTVAPMVSNPRYKKFTEAVVNIWAVAASADLARDKALALLTKLQYSVLSVARDGEETILEDLREPQHRSHFQTAQLYGTSAFFSLPEPFSAGEDVS